MGDLVGTVGVSLSNPHTRSQWHSTPNDGEKGWQYSISVFCHQSSQSISDSDGRIRLSLDCQEQSGQAVRNIVKHPRTVWDS